MTRHFRLIGFAGAVSVAITLGFVVTAARSSPPPKAAVAKSEKRANRLPDDEILRQVQPLWPEFHARLVEAKDKDPREYRERMDRVAPVIERCDQLRRNKNPGLADLLWETFHLGEECRELARQYHNAPDDRTRTALAGQMREKVSQQVDLELKQRQFELAEFQKKIDKMGKELKEQSDRKEKLVAERVQRWTGGKAGDSKPPKLSQPTSSATVAMPKGADK